MNKQKEIILSSSMTNSGQGIAAIALVFFVPVFALVVMAEGFHFGTVFGAFFYLLAVWIFTRNSALLCEARVVGDQIFLKKLKKPEIQITADQITDISSYQTKGAKHTVIEIKDEHGEPEQYMIVHLNRTEHDAEVVLRGMMEEE